MCDCVDRSACEAKELKNGRKPSINLQPVAIDRLQRTQLGVRLRLSVTTRVIAPATRACNPPCGLILAGGLTSRAPGLAVGTHQHFHSSPYHWLTAQRAQGEKPSVAGAPRVEACRMDSNGQTWCFTPSQPQQNGCLS